MAPAIGHFAGRIVWFALAKTIFLVTCVGSFAQERPGGFVAPPRTIADITAVLDQEKPDPKLAANLRAEADAIAPAGAGGGQLAKFYLTRCQARSLLGEFGKAIADCEAAVRAGQGSLDLAAFGRILQGLSIQYAQIGEPKKSIEISQRIVRETSNVKGAKGRVFNATRHILENYLTLGDFEQAEAYARRNIALLQEARSWPSYAGFRKASWEAEIEQGRAALHEARGQFAEAEAAYRRGEILRREALRLLPGYDGLAPPRDQLEQNIDAMIAKQGRVKARQGRLAEGEADVRRALLSRLRATGKYNVQTAKYIGFLANLLIEQGRFGEAERLARIQLEVQRTMGVAADSDNVTSALNQLASIFNLEGRWSEAAEAYAALDEATRNWPPARKEALILNTNHIATLYNTNNLSVGIAAAERLLTRQRGRFGEQHQETALARGMLAIGLSRAGRDAEAAREFKIAIPLLMATSRNTDTDDAIDTAAREQRTAVVVEAYIQLLARSAAPDAGAESFRFADVVRGRSVQKALAASSARAATRNPALAELARKAQDLEKQVAAQLGSLNNALALPSDQRDEKALKALQVDIDKLRSARDVAQRDLAGRFREYASLVEPQSPSVEDIRAVLRPNEAFVSFYFGREASFVWAVPKVGPVGFAGLPLTAGGLEAKVGKLREALEQGETIEEIPPFDLALAYELYQTILQPVEAVWRPAKSLIVATNGALGLLPLGLLPTSPAREIESKLTFEGYRQVAWLARTHAVSQIPSAAALRTLRQLPQGSDKREKLIGFGDPLFSAEQAADAQKEDAARVQVAIAQRGIPLKRRASAQTMNVDSASLARLPRLPDTAEELRSVALALEADPAKVLKLGKDANEKNVKGTDLTRFRIIAFATHGLVPGELDGLTQPALALSAPNVADVDGDGLLTMEEILALKLDADWVVLSACNTAAGAGAGAEAASGLGRAFFYAGSRALLVTNWSVHSASARELVTDLFRRQAADAGLSRAEALRQAMTALMDGPGFAEEGKMLFSYAHPLFWAPYTIIGDGGAN
jgi:CHAT domain-containing protein